jgi:hypothetical protein
MGTTSACTLDCLQRRQGNFKLARSCAGEKFIKIWGRRPRGDAGRRTRVVLEACRLLHVPCGCREGCLLPHTDARCLHPGQASSGRTRSCRLGISRDSLHQLGHCRSPACGLLTPAPLQRLPGPSLYFHSFWSRPSQAITHRTLFSITTLHDHSNGSQVLPEGARLPPDHTTNWLCAAPRDWS